MLIIKEIKMIPKKSDKLTNKSFIQNNFSNSKLSFDKSKLTDKSLIQKSPENIDLNKRDFIKKSVLGLAGLGGIAAFSSLAKAGIIFRDSSYQSGSGFIDGKTDTVITASDQIVFADATDNDNAKKDTVQGILDLAGGITITSETSVGTGLSVTISGIPSGTKRFTLMYEGVSDDNGSYQIIQLGDSGGIETTGYKSAAATLATSEQEASSGSNGFQTQHDSSSEGLDMAVTFTLKDETNNTWLATGTGQTGSAATAFMAGIKSLSGELTQLRLQTNPNTGNFDAGDVSLLLG